MITVVESVEEWPYSLVCADFRKGILRDNPMREIDKCLPERLLKIFSVLIRPCIISKQFVEEGQERSWLEHVRGFPFSFFPRCSVVARNKQNGPGSKFTDEALLNKSRLAQTLTECVENLRPEIRFLVKEFNGSKNKKGFGG